MGVKRSLAATQNPAILQLCGDYAKQRLYSELFYNLTMLGTKQFVYVPVRTSKELNKFLLKGDCIDFRYVKILKKYHRIFFRQKIHTLFRDVKQHVALDQFGLVHAHFLYSDGAVARMLHKHFGIPYVVSVRNTDINFFMKWRPDLRWFCWDILKNASKIIFLSPAYQKLLSQRVPNEIAAILLDKGVVLPNGLDFIWLENGVKAKREVKSPLRIIYVGDFSSNKNVLNIINAVEIVGLQKKVTLTLVGADDKGFLRKYLQSDRWSFMRHIDRIDDRLRLRDIIQSHDIFVMPSYFETFGLAYIEALSQGLPIVHSRGQGIDGYFPGSKIAVPVNPHSPDDIAMGILTLDKRLPFVSEDCIMAAKKFAWPDIASQYQEIYRGIALKKGK